MESSTALQLYSAPERSTSLQLYSALHSTSSIHPPSKHSGLKREFYNKSSLARHWARDWRALALTMKRESKMREKNRFPVRLCYSSHSCPGLGPCEESRRLHEDDSCVKRLCSPPRPRTWRAARARACACERASERTRAWSRLYTHHPVRARRGGNGGTSGAQSHGLWYLRLFGAEVTAVFFAPVVLVLTAQDKRVS